MKSYGILEQNIINNDLDLNIEELERNGYTIINSNYTLDEQENISNSYNDVFDLYRVKYGYEYLKNINEYFSVRQPFAIEKNDDFKNLVKNKNLNYILEKLFKTKYTLNQQNCVTNPPNQEYDSSSWHRDLPYQHFTSSRPLAINALYCIDDFTKENGSTLVLPFSHKQEAMSSNEFLKKHAIQVEAPKGSFIILDCLTYHAGAFNRTSNIRRSINNVFTIPLIKKQISFNDKNSDEIFGTEFEVANDVTSFLKSREYKK